MMMMNRKRKFISFLTRRRDFGTKATTATTIQPKSPSKATFSLSLAHAHPHHFRQHLRLTDGSLTAVPSISPLRPLLSLNIDARSHPSWNPRLRNRILLDEEGGEVARFRTKFANIMMLADEGAFLDDCADVVGAAAVAESQKKRMPPLEKKRPAGGSLAGKSGGGGGKKK